MINSKVNLEKIKRSFSDSKPFKHVFIKDFLERGEYGKTYKSLVRETFEIKNSDLFSFSQTCDFSSINHKDLKFFYNFLVSKEFSDFVSKIYGKKLKVGAINVSGTLYQKGDYLLCHDDMLDDRKIAFMFYFSDLSKKDGGSFDMISLKKNSDFGILKSITPKENSFFMFEVSNKSFHQVQEVLTDIKRYSISGWLK